MDELVAQIAANVGVDPGVARKAVVIVLKFLATEAPDKAGPLIDGLPGAREALAGAPDVSGGIMGVFGALTGAGLGMGEVQGVAREFGSYARAKLGNDAVDSVVASVPGLSQFV